MTLCSKPLSEHNSEDKRVIGEESGRDLSGLGTVSRSPCALVCHLWAVLGEYCREWKAQGRRREMSQSSLGRQISQTVGNHPTGARDSMFTGQMYAEEWVVSSTSNSKPGNHKLRLQLNLEATERWTEGLMEVSVPLTQAFTRLCGGPRAWALVSGSHGRWISMRGRQMHELSRIDIFGLHTYSQRNMYPS